MMLSKSDAILVVIDFQERMMPHIDRGNEVLRNVRKLIKAARIFNLPIIVTKQKKLGNTVEEISDILGEEAIEKTTFSCYKNKEFAGRIEGIGRKQCIITGIETHICILQTALDLKEAGYEVHVAVDCTSSRKKYEKDVAIKRMMQEGVFLTTAETAIYEMLVDAEAEEFKDILSIVKEG